MNYCLIMGVVCRYRRCPLPVISRGSTLFIFKKTCMYYFFFWQTDLCGLKWRKYVFNLACQANPAEDPVLKSFSAALNHDILCAWRRSPLTQPGGDPNSISGAKELWVFWFGDDPNLQGIVSAELKGNGSSFT